MGFHWESICVGSEDWVGVGHVESAVLHALQNKTDRRRICDVRGMCEASTASEEAADPSEVVEDDSS